MVLHTTLGTHFYKKVATTWVTKLKLLARYLPTIAFEIQISLTECSLFQNMALVGEGSPGSAFISAGDRHGIKQAAPQTFLKDAAESGAHFADRTYVSEVLHDGKGSVTGVKAVTTGASGQELKVTVRARIVVVSCGSINTPALLMRSQIPKLNQSGQLGKNLRLHPVATTLAVMPEKVKVWEGVPTLLYI